ncbi:MAG: hypothetical protein GY814_14305, partial [Gammaproteobacteria bacterium]|nr:hypothetical protein [Gammaproteobacteria bacterium]
MTAESVVSRLSGANASTGTGTGAGTGTDTNTDIPPQTIYTAPPLTPEQEQVKNRLDKEREAMVAKESADYFAYHMNQVDRKKGNINHLEEALTSSSGNTNVGSGFTVKQPDNPPSMPAGQTRTKPVTPAQLTKNPGKFQDYESKGAPTPDTYDKTKKDLIEHVKGEKKLNKNKRVHHAMNMLDA